MRANIYSMEPLNPVTREAVDDGVSAVAAYMGETIVKRECTAIFPLNNGLVKPERVGFTTFDPTVELHVMAVPLFRSGQRSGVAMTNSGFSFIDIGSNFPDSIRSCTSHEVAHSLGFVLRGSKQLDPESPTHCIQKSCIMNRSSVIITKEIRTEHAQTKLQKLLRRAVRYDSEIRQTIADQQYDFCTDCKFDLYTCGNQQLNNLRYNRSRFKTNIRFM